MCPCDRAIERTFDLVKIEGRPYLTFADRMVPADLVQEVGRTDDGTLYVRYNAGGEPFTTVCRPIPR